MPGQRTCATGWRVRSTSAFNGPLMRDRSAIILFIMRSKSLRKVHAAVLDERERRSAAKAAKQLCDAAISAAFAAGHTNLEVAREVAAAHGNGRGTPAATRFQDRVRQRCSRARRKRDKRSRD